MVRAISPEDGRSIPPSPLKHFSGKIEGGSRCDLAHLLGAMLLQGGWRYGPAIFRGDCSHHEAQVPCEFKQIGHGSLFRENWGQLQTWFGTFTQDSTAPRGGWYPLAVFKAHLPTTWHSSPVGFKQIEHGSFSRKNEGGCGCDLVHLLGVALLQGGWGMDLPSSGRLPSPWCRSPLSFEQMGHGSFFTENWGRL